MPSKLTIEEIAGILKPVALAPLCERPLVSILTANYNYARFIGEAIESAQAQTYTNWEMIVCDDGSTDESCEIVERYVERDPRIRLVSKENGGQVSAANAAYAESKGEIVCFLDADDRFVPQKLEKVVGAFRSHPDCGFAGHRMFQIDVSGRRLGITPAITDPPRGWYGPSVVLCGSHIPGLPVSSAQCVRREISDQIFPVSEAFTAGPDGAVLALAPLMTPIIGMAEVLTEYRMHGNNSNGHIRIAARRNGSGSADRRQQIYSIYRETHIAMWEAGKDYLEEINPLFASVYPPFGDSEEGTEAAYRRARQQSWTKGLRCYRAMMRAEGFRMQHRATQWFWRASILLPWPVVRYASSPNRIKFMIWRALEVRRRYLDLGRAERRGS